MQAKAISTDTVRVSVSSGPSSSSQGSGQDDYDAMGDVYMWGKNICDGILGGGMQNIGSAFNTKVDALLPKALESAVVLDVHGIACGGRHAALVTRQGEVFTWGDVSGGRLGHGVGLDVSGPQLVEALANYSVEFIACGEYHTCAVTSLGELYTWGDGDHNVGLLGHGNNVSHWIPKRVNGPLDGVQIQSVACGQWHTALVTSAGQLFTFGDGTFGVLGHGDCRSVSYPREVESLRGLKTLSVACGVWHTAAAIEVMVGSSSASNCCSGKLFTWGDGEHGRLGHGDKEKKLVPTCVPSLIDYNFQQVACGHSLTVALTTSGQVLTMGNSAYGQLGNPQSDGKLPCVVGEKLLEETVDEIACGAYHVAVLTAKAEVYTWGKGANGRLGHGDVGDRKTPTLVEALKDKPVKSIACGSNFTAAICIHKWVSGADQSVCSGCRQSFGFTRKRHNCYHCGLVYCHSCSSKKALKAALSPNPNKPHRVCDSCLAKLRKASEAAQGPNVSKRNILPRPPNDARDRSDRPDLKASKSPWLTNREPFKQLEGKSQTKRGKKSESLYSARDVQAQSLLQLKDLYFLNTPDPLQAVTKTLIPSLPQSRNISRVVSPFSRRSSPLRSTTPVPTMTGLALPLANVDELKKKNEILTQEVLKLRALAGKLTQQCQLQEAELQRVTKQAQEARTLVGEESSKCKAAKEVIMSLTAQLKDMARRLQVEEYDKDRIKPACHPHERAPNDVPPPAVYDAYLAIDKENGNTEASNDACRPTVHSSYGAIDRESSNPTALKDKDEFSVAASGTSDSDANGIVSLHHSPVRAVTADQGSLQPKALRQPGRGSELETLQKLGKRPATAVGENGYEARREWVEQDAPGVYLTLALLSDGTKDLKRVRFSRKRFSEGQAEIWWTENRARVFQQYNIQGIDRAMAGGSLQAKSGKADEVAAPVLSSTQ